MNVYIKEGVMKQLKLTEAELTVPWDEYSYAHLVLPMVVRMAVEHPDKVYARHPEIAHYHPGDDFVSVSGIRCWEDHSPIGKCWRCGWEYKRDAHG